MRLSITLEIETTDDDVDAAEVIARYVVVELDDVGHDGLTMWEVDNFTVAEIEEFTER